MRATSFLRSLGRNDARLIRRDSFLLGVIMIPIITALVLRFGVPPLTGWLEASWRFDLTPYYGLIVSYMIVLLTPVSMGILVGFMLLDERDDRTLAALLVTPLPLWGFLAYRTMVPALLSTALVPLGFYLAGLVTLPFGELLAVSLAASLIAPGTALLFPAFAANKVQGFGIQKLLNVILIVPVAAYFIPPPWRHVMGIVFPPYWPLEAFWRFAEGASGAGIFVLLGIMTQLSLCLLLVRRFARVVHGPVS